MKPMRSMIVIGLITVLSAGSALAQQGNMENAIEHLRAAPAALDRAQHNKCGDRERALEHVDAAIPECQAGIAYARSHR
jgi:hypothetical protein